MNAILLLVGLLVLSYIGSFLVGGRALRGLPGHLDRDLRLPPEVATTVAIATLRAFADFPPAVRLIADDDDQRTMVDLLGPAGRGCLTVTNRRESHRIVILDECLSTLLLASLATS